MDVVERYLSVWNHMRPKFEHLIKEIEQSVMSRIPEVVRIEPKPHERGDEEYILSQDWRIKDREDSAMGIDIYLTDAQVRADEDIEGYGIFIDVQSWSDGPVVQVSPYNFTESAFTLNLEELDFQIGQITNSHVIEIADYICEKFQTYAHQKSQTPKC